MYNRGMELIMPEYTTDEAAAKLNLKSASTIRHAIRRGELVANKRGRDLFIEESELMRWAETHQPKPRKPYTKRNR